DNRIGLCQSSHCPNSNSFLSDIKMAKTFDFAHLISTASLFLEPTQTHHIFKHLKDFFCAELFQNFLFQTFLSFSFKQKMVVRKFVAPGGKRRFFTSVVLLDLVEILTVRTLCHGCSQSKQKFP